MPLIAIKTVADLCEGKLLLKERTASARRVEFCRRCLQNAVFIIGAIPNEGRMVHRQGVLGQKNASRWGGNYPTRVLQYVISYD
jgi:hypothetical protein